MATSYTCSRHGDVPRNHTCGFGSRVKRAKRGDSNIPPSAGQVMGRAAVRAAGSVRRANRLPQLAPSDAKGRPMEPSRIGERNSAIVGRMFILALILAGVVIFVATH